MSTVIVSNQPGTVDLLCRYLKESNAKGDIEVFSTTTDALKRIHDPERLRPRQIFVELSGLPEAVRLVDWMKGSGSTRSLPVIVIGDETETVTIRYLEAIGVDAILQKPLQLDAVQRLFLAPQISSASAAP
jgi:hypothetical protein